MVGLVTVCTGVGEDGQNFRKSGQAYLQWLGTWLELQQEQARGSTVSASLGGYGHSLQHGQSFSKYL